MTSSQKRRWYPTFNRRRRSSAPSTRTIASCNNRSLRVDALEDRRMLAGSAGDIVTIGDSWAWLIAANAPGSAPPVPGFNNSLQQMLDVFHPGATVYNESFGGGLAAQHVLDLAGITNRINANPDADVVWLSSGGNDIVGGAFVGGYNILNGVDLNALKTRIVNDVMTIANHILSIRPDIQVVIEGYDYINIWDTYSPVSAGDVDRLALYGIVRADTGFPLFDDAFNLASNADFNSYMKDVGTGANSKKTIGDNSSRIHYIDNFGLNSSVFGYNGFLGNVPATGVFPPDQYPALPTDISLMNDPIHLNSAGYLNLSLRAEQEFFSTAFQDAVLATSTSTLNFGNVRVGDTSGSQTVTASNAGPNFTKVKDVIFPGGSGDFSGSGSASNPLFMDPSLGSDTAVSAPYNFSPGTRGNSSANLTVTSDSGNQPLTLSGTGVGPVYDSVSTLDLGTIVQGGSTSQTIDINNITTDGDLGSLTDLTLLTTTLTGPDAAAFSLDTFVPLTVIGASGIEVLSVEFDATGLSPGAKTATLTFTTDEGSSVGTLGAQFQVTLTVIVDPAATADIGGPYTGDEGTLIALSGAASTGAVLYEWDLDNDGQYDDATGENVNFNAADNGVFTIGLRINGDNSLTDATTVTVNNVAPAAAISGTTDIYRGETVIYTLTATDPSPVDQAGLFTFEIDWDGNGTVDETVANVISGTTVQRTFPTLAANDIQVRATDKDAATGSFAQTPITVSPHVLRDDGFGNIDLIYGGTPGFDAVFVLGSGPGLSLFVQFENLVAVNRLDFIGSGVTGKIILHGYDFIDVLVGQFANGNVVEIHGGDGDDVVVGGPLSDILFGDGGNDLILGGTQATDGDDQLFGGSGRDVLFGNIGADTLDGGTGEDLLVSDRLNFTGSTAQAVIAISDEWKSARPFAERVTNILGTTFTGSNGSTILDPGVNILDDVAQDTLIGGLGDLDWFFYDFDQDLLGDAIEVDEEETDSDP